MPDISRPLGPYEASQRLCEGVEPDVDELSRGSGFFFGGLMTLLKGGSPRRARRALRALCLT
ncbi:MAG: hypothetical protein CMH57_04025 [Myxococcales bacterium]|nr:hypothetical protein [Myxococcales bacterium]